MIKQHVQRRALLHCGIYDMLLPAYQKVYKMLRHRLDDGTRSILNECLQDLILYSKEQPKELPHIQIELDLNTKVTYMTTWSKGKRKKGRTLDISHFYEGQERVYHRFWRKIHKIYYLHQRPSVPN